MDGHSSHYFHIRASTGISARLDADCRNVRNVRETHHFFFCTIVEWYFSVSFLDNKSQHFWGKAISFLRAHTYIYKKERYALTKTFFFFWVEVSQILEGRIGMRCIRLRFSFCFAFIACLSKNLVALCQHMPSCKAWLPTVAGDATFTLA